MHSPFVDGRGSRGHSFVPAELESLRARAQGSECAARRFPPAVEDEYQRYQRAEGGRTRAVLLLCLTAAMALAAALEGHLLLVLGTCLCFVGATLQLRNAEARHSEWLVLGALGLLMLLVGSWTPEGHSQRPLDLFLFCAALGVLLFARLPIRSSLLLIVLYLSAVIWTDRGAAPDGQTLSHWPVNAVLLLLIAGSSWSLRLAQRRSWAMMRLLDIEAHQDALTGLPNRRALEQHYRAISREPTRSKQGAILAFALIDLDYFKQVNDRYGHEYGDRVLTRIGAELSESGAAHGDFVARLAGEEFVLILRGHDADHVRRRLQEVIRRIECLRIPNRESPYRWVTASVGWVPIQMGSRFLDPYVAADRNLYRAKFSGRNLVQGPEVSPSPQLAQPLDDALQCEAIREWPTPGEPC